MQKFYPCPCCGFLTITDPPPGTFEICPVCGWEDDDVQFYDHEYEGGANDGGQAWNSAIRRLK